MTNKAYREYCAAQRDRIPIFHQDWWLDAVVGTDRWQGLISTSKVAGRAAILPIYLQRRRGFTIIRNPPLTPYQGPWWAGYASADYATRHQVAQQLWPELLAQIPRHLTFRQRFHPAVQEALSWHTAGYALGARYTFTLDLAASPPNIRAGFRRDIRRKLRQAHRWHCQPSQELRAFFPLIEHVYHRQGQSVPYTLPLLQRIQEAAKNREAIELTLAEKDGDRGGGLLLVRDNERLYVLASGLSASGRQAGAFPALVWQAIQDWQGKGLVLDFCGSMLPGVADNNAAFGAKASLILAAEQQAWWLKLVDQGQ